ncbi:SOS response-associated peptidase family protein [Sphingomonas phyllosphaerae]|uniref:SOS response-associated peptidase family protein n=1 Tax=Sphingomonas phyllosphaerae TaxID=257003 RepID=UPI0024130C95|nr:SOS response-associated peptidase family protein [Sphingomonas phyllosphaerae]
MCNRYRMTEAQFALATRYGVAVPFPPDLEVPPPELFPDRPAYVVRETNAGRALDAMACGFPHQVPGKRIDKATGKPALLTKKITNVRNYTSPFWRSALANPRRRCLVPFTAFSEYGQDRGADGKLPLHWFDVPSRAIVSFAGVWRPTEQGARCGTRATTAPAPASTPTCSTASTPATCATSPGCSTGPRPTRPRRTRTPRPISPAPSRHR